MTLRFLGYYCKIRLLPLLLFVALLALLIRLGFWQLDRAEVKRQFLQLEQEKAHMQAVPLLSLLVHAKQDFKYRKVELQGYYDTQHQFLIDNQIYLGKVGYFVLTPFVLKSQDIVLVNRGWLPMSQDRQLPDISLSPSIGEQTIVGIINDFPGVGLILKGADEPGKGWPSVVQIINAQKIAQKLGYVVLDFQVQLLPTQNDGYTRDWQISTKMPPEKHKAYAFQWFALAVTLILLTLWISCKKETND